MEVNLNIEEPDMEGIKSFLKGKEEPQKLDDLVYHLALAKTRHLRKNRVKIYDPACEYREGDLIYKEYTGKLPTGSKKYIELDRGVVMKVIGVRTRFGLHEIQLDYDGTSDFRKYTQYLDRQKIELLLPHRQAKPIKKPEYLDESKDPRLQQQPLVDRDFNQLRRKVITSLNRISGVAFICNQLLLEENLKPVADAVFDHIREFLKESRKSESTEFFVENFAKVSPEDPSFPAHCFSLNFRMRRDFKIDFHQTSMLGWGRWHLISVIYHLKKDALISMPNPLSGRTQLVNRKNLAQRRKQLTAELFLEPHRFYLTQREVSSGALRIKPGLFKFGDSMELNAMEVGTKKELTLYYYQDDQLIMGFHDHFNSIKALQAMSMTLEQVGEDQFQFEIRTTKKGTVADRVDFDPEKGTFQVTDEKVASPVFVNKTMFLEPEVFQILHEHIDDFREADSFNDLVQRVFLVFGLRERNYEIHTLRLYHILDLIYPVRLQAVEDVLLAGAEFVPSEKIAGVFFLDSEIVGETQEEERDRLRDMHEGESAAEEEPPLEEIEEVPVLEPEAAPEPETNGTESSEEEEIRLLREERRRKREDEMRLKEERLRRIRMEKLGEKLASRTAPEPEMPPPAPEVEPERKTRRRQEEEKTPKPKKRVEKAEPLEEETLDMEEIKQEIQLEQLKEKVLEKKATIVPKDKKEIAYHDNGGFGGVLASQLDQLAADNKEEKTKAGDDPEEGEEEGK